MVSEDLINWSAPATLWEAPLLWRRDCAAPAAYAYPSLLDEGGASPNFDTLGDGFWLYLVRMKLGEGCAVGPDRDLVRMRVSWPATAAPSAATPSRPGGDAKSAGEICWPVKGWTVPALIFSSITSRARSMSSNGASNRS